MDPGEDGEEIRRSKYSILSELVKYVLKFLKRNFKISGVNIFSQ